MRSAVYIFSLLLPFAHNSLAVAQQAAPPVRVQVLQTVSQIEDDSVRKVERGAVEAAEAMPEDRFTFAPSNGEFKGVRTFALQVKHVAVTNYVMASAILRETAPVELGSINGPDFMTSKAEIMNFLKGSFSYLHKAVTSINEKNATEQIPNPEGAGTVPKLDVATRQLWHDMDHCGQMVLYRRMYGIVPPASRGQGQP
jgi:DinB family protein